MESFRLPHQSSWAAISRPVALAEPLAAWEILGQPEFAWERPSQGQASAGYGVLSSVEAEPRTIAQALDGLASSPLMWLGDRSVPCPPGPWFGGLAFDPRRPGGNGWAGFPASRWILPEVLLWRRDGQTYLTVFSQQLATEAKTEQSLERRWVRACERLPPSSSLPLEEGRHFPSVAPLSETERENWTRLVGRALKNIQSGALAKVVVARSIDVESAHRFDCIRILSSLREAAPSCTLFLVRGVDGSVFLGATPEMLCRWSDSVLETEAIAGSASSSGAQALLESDKEHREHRAVIDGITEALGPLSQAIAVDRSPALLALRHLFHLRTAISARLVPGVKVSEVLSALHPTPAVGGTPRDRALGFLAEHEGLERGWYGGTIGWLGEGEVELAVAIRSALVKDRRARLFVGAGVVSGSTAEGEWEETEIKSLTLLAALGGAHAGG